MSIFKHKSLSLRKSEEIHFDRSLLDMRPEKQGFLVKHKCIRGDFAKATITSNWKKRYFQLINGVMVYLKLPSDSSPKGWFELEGARIEMAEERTGRKLCFAVHTADNRTFLMVASTSDALANWLAAIRNVIDPPEPLTSRASESVFAAPMSKKPPMLKREVSRDTLGRPKPQPISLAAKRVRFKTDIQGVAPSPRHRQGTFMVDGVRMLIFGGMDDSGKPQGDLMVFNLGSATWDPYTVSGTAPCAREGHSISTHRENVYVFGGKGEAGVCNDLALLNMEDLEWSAPPVSGDLPPGRHGHGAVIVMGSMFILGGMGENDTLLNDMYVMDLMSDTWRALEVDTEVGLKPTANMACHPFDETIVAFGGWAKDGFSNRTYMYDVREQVWVTESPQGEPPSPRQSCASTAFKNRILFLVGGEGDDGMLSDIWALDVGAYLWMKITLSGNPLPAFSGMSVCVKDQVMYLFGGKVESGLSNAVAVIKVMDKGLPSISLRNAGARPSFVTRMQIKAPSLEDFNVGVVLGTGSFGRVHCVQYKSTGKYYALKILKKKEILHLNQVDHINQEKEVLASICHPHVVNFCGSFQDNKKLYIIMEFVSGGEFFTHLRKAGRFKDDDARFYAAEIFSALDYMHSNDIVYRDLKPENILLDDRGHAKITDFGFAKQVEFRTWTLCGTPEYLAPEIILSKGHSKPADYWAFGILVFEMLAGYPPFYDDEPLRIYQKILQGNIKWPYHFSADAKDFISQLLVADPSKRLGSSKRGAATIKEHPWFKTVDWQDIVSCALKAPLQPKTGGHEGDTSNFERYPDEPDEDWPECTDAENARFANFG